jgi:hypothetical protein
LRLVAGGALVGAIALHSAAGADRRNTAADPTKPMPFDLPAQPLASALESYSVSSGWQVIYNGRLTAGRQSSAVKGDFTPGAALRMLLAGTSLIPQYRAVDGAILVPDPMATLGPDEIADNVAKAFSAVLIVFSAAFGPFQPIISSRLLSSSARLRNVRVQLRSRLLRRIP